MLAANFKRTHQLNCATWPGVKYKCKDIAVCSRSQTQLKYARGVMLSAGEGMQPGSQESCRQHSGAYRIQRQEGSELETTLLPVKPFLCVC